MSQRVVGPRPFPSKLSDHWRHSSDIIQIVQQIFTSNSVFARQISKYWCIHRFPNNQSRILQLGIRMLHSINQFSKVSKRACRLLHDLLSKLQSRYNRMCRFDFIESTRLDATYHFSEIRWNVPIAAWLHNTRNRSNQNVSFVGSMTNEFIEMKLQQRKQGKQNT